MKNPSHYEGGVGTAEEIGLRLVRGLGIPDGPDALRNLRSKTPKELLDVSDRDSTVNFDIESDIDGWVLPEQPATTFARSRQAKVPVLVGSNANEGTNMIEETLHGPPTLANYKTFLKNEFLDYADEIFRMYPAATDEDKKLVHLMTGYWTQFAKTGDPNGPGLPPWPVYDPKADLVQEIGHEVRLRPTPHTDRFTLFERSLNSRLASIPPSGQGAVGHDSAAVNAETVGTQYWGGCNPITEHSTVCPDDNGKQRPPKTGGFCGRQRCLSCFGALPCVAQELKQPDPSGCKP